MWSWRTLLNIHKDSHFKLHLFAWLVTWPVVGASLVRSWEFFSILPCFLLFSGNKVQSSGLSIVCYLLPISFSIYPTSFPIHSSLEYLGGLTDKTYDTFLVFTTVRSSSNGPTVCKNSVANIIIGNVILIKIIFSILR